MLVCVIIGLAVSSLAVVIGWPGSSIPAPAVAGDTFFSTADRVERSPERVERVMGVAAVPISGSPYLQRRTRVP
jgi:hypothetical protein